MNEHKTYTEEVFATTGVFIVYDGTRIFMKLDARTQEESDQAVNAINALKVLLPKTQPQEADNGT